MGNKWSAMLQEASAHGEGRELFVRDQSVREGTLRKAEEAVPKALPKLSVLEVSACELTVVPAYVGGWTTLTQLNLEGNQLSVLPASLSQLGQLRHLKLSRNRFSEFPQFDGALAESLHTLDLSGNRIAAVPRPQLARLKGIRVLSLADNGMDVPIAAYAMPTLVSLDLSCNRLKQLPSDMAALTRLRSLDVHSNLLTDLQAATQLPSLRELNASSNALEGLPAGLPAWLHLQTLSLAHNRLTELPASLGVLTALTTLRLHDNRLEALPSAVGQLMALTELTLQENRLQSLPNEIGQCRRLQKLYAEYNALEALPDSVAQLKELVILILHHNRIRALPEALPQLEQLLRLSVEDNPLPPAVLAQIEAHGALSLLGTEFSGRTQTRRGSTYVPSGSLAESSPSSSSSTVKSSAGGGSASPRGIDPTRAEEELKKFASVRRFDSLAMSTDGSGGSKRLPNPNRDKGKEKDKEKERAGGDPLSMSSSAPMASASAMDGGRRASVGGLGLPGGSGGSGGTQLKYDRFRSTFEKMLEEQDFSSQRREELQKLSTGEKWRLLEQYKASTLDMLSNGRGGSTSGGKERPPEEVVAALRSRPMAQHLTEILEHVRQGRGPWVAGFIDHHGLAELALVMVACATRKRKSRRDQLILAHGLQCMEAFLNVSMRSLLSTPLAIPAIVAPLAMEDDALQAKSLAIAATICTLHASGSRLISHALAQEKPSSFSSSLPSNREKLEKNNTTDRGEKLEKNTSGEKKLEKNTSDREKLEKSTTDRDKIDKQESGESGSPYPGYLRLLRFLDEEETRVDGLTVINAVVGEEPELSRRLELRGLFIRHGLLGVLERLRASRPSQLVVLQMERFEQDLASDYEEMVAHFEKDRLLELMQASSSDDRADVPSLRVLLPFSSRAKNVVLPLTDGTTSAVAVALLAQSTRLPPWIDPKALQLRHHSWGVLGSDAPLRQLYPIDRQVLVELALPAAVVDVAVDRSIPAHVPSGVTRASPAQRLLALSEESTERVPVNVFRLQVDPCARVTDELRRLCPALGVPGEPEDYCLRSLRVVQGAAASPTLLADTRRLIHYEMPWTAMASVEGGSAMLLWLRKVSMDVRVALASNDASTALVINQDLDAPVRSLLLSAYRRFRGKFPITSERRVGPPSQFKGGSSSGSLLLHSVEEEYGLYCKGDSGGKYKFMDPERRLSEFGLREGALVRLKMRPVAVRVAVPDDWRMKPAFGAGEAVLLELVWTVAEALRRVVAKHRVSGPQPADAYGLALDGAGSRTLMLHQSLRDQGVCAGSALRVVACSRDEDEAGGGALSMWDEPASAEWLVLDADGATPLHASLNKLVERLTSAHEIDADFAATFVATYPSFCSDRALFRKLRERYDVPKKASLSSVDVDRIQTRVCTFLRDWLTYSNSSQLVNASQLANASHLSGGMGSTLNGLFSKPQATLKKEEVEEFVRVLQAGGRADLAALVQRAMDAPPLPTGVASMGSKPLSFPPLSARSSGLSQTLVDWDAAVLARALTARSWDKFRAVTSAEFHGSAWSKADAPARCAALLALIDDFNLVAAFAAAQVVLPGKLRDRVRAFAHLVAVAEQLRALNNYHLLQAVVSGVNTSAVLRLKWTRAKLPKAAQTSLAALEALMSMEGSYKGYRAALAASTPPLIPYMGVYLTDLTFIEDGNPSLVGPHALINFSKRRQVYAITAAVRQYQQFPYALPDLPEDVLRWISSLPIPTEKELYEASLLAEPRGSSRADIK